MKKELILLGLGLCLCGTQIYALDNASPVGQTVLPAGFDLDQLKEEVRWINLKAVRAAVDNMKKMQGFDVIAAERKLAELAGLTEAGFEGLETGDSAAVDRAVKALALKKEILFANPLLDVDKILTIRYRVGDHDKQIMTPNLGTQPNNWSNQMSAWRNGFDAELVELSNLRGDLRSRTVLKAPRKGASIADPVLHWNADRLMFTSLDSMNRWRVFEVNTDGTGLHQVIENDELDLEFIDATYLPDGRVIAVSNIGYNGVPCVNGSDPVGNMVQYNPKTKEMRRLTFDQDANWHPTPLANGKIMYTRWEYTDLTHYFSRIVMHMNPDGTEQKSLYGSGSLFPNAIFDMQPLPGNTVRFVGIISGHHGIARSGRMIIFDPSISRKEEKGMVQEIPFSTREIVPEIKDELVNGVWPQFIKPYPLNDDYFLVTAKLAPNTRWGIYLVDIFDNVTPLALNEGEGFIYSIPVKKRPVPPVIPDKIKPGSKEATVYIQDVYEGEGLRGVKRGTVKELRVFAYEYAYLNTLSDHYMQGIQSGWDIKRLLGTVPVEEDGSCIFTIPANTPISLQPLDAEGRAVQWMRSWLTGMPGEVVSCVGCHEDQNTLPRPSNNIASKKQPSSILVTEGGPHSITFGLDIQPILDRACVACHNGENADIPNFKDTSRVGITDWSGTRYYGKSYLAFHPYVNRQGPEADMYVMKPYEYHASTSEVVRMLKEGHKNVRLTDAEWRKLYAWIDMNAPYWGMFNANDIHGIKQISRREELADKYANGAGVNWQAEIAAYADYLKAQGPVTAVMPEPETAPVYSKVSVKRWPMTEEAVKDLQTQAGETRKEVEIAPGVKIAFVRIPAGSFVMGDNNRPVSAPEHKAVVKKAFWMSEKEITNEQYEAIFPEYDSRIYAQFWKDHTTPGYPANKPGQPVVRVSYNEAMDYCDKLKEKTGLNVTLPTETQWEWACRAGSDTDFWFGNKGVDFGGYENLADVQLEKMAVTGIDPQPMSKEDPWFPYYNYLPKNDRVDDGRMIPQGVGEYKPNAFGLYDMHGNLAELTRTEYAPYAKKKDKTVQADNESVVVRGGSWISREKDATAAYRTSRLKWQGSNNVGLRLVIED